MRGITTALVLVAGLGCVEPNPDIGRPCDSSMPCPVGMLCLSDYTGIPVCMEECAPTDLTMCADLSTCLDAPLGERACYPGGPLREGNVCTSTLDCMRGGLCVHFEGEAEARCYRACDLGRTVHCRTGEICRATIEGEGFCAP